ncbi:hypothetical protein INT45_002883 [Circinella minor]|uniref:CCHC-type domain-containing protein n=1 Tax=Circinella minor TaxID=1195481 RepID=A0A8H7VNW5_9FUNG|nr:hypothetical protein INT45_002883 [Circinella minor]
MASPQQNTKPSEGGTLHDSKHAPRLLDPQMTWSQIIQNKRVSLMHNTLKETHISSTTQKSPTEWTSIHSHVWRVGNSPYQSVFIDISTRPENELTVIQMAKQQFPELMGVIPLHEGKHCVLLELAFDDNNVLQRALTVGLEFPKNKTRILGACAMPNKGIVCKLCLSRLPLIREAELLSTLQESLQPYGRILDIGSFREPTTNFFMGSGYAILDCQPVLEEHPYQELKHIIDWAGEYEHAFYATWADIPLYCTWCHEQGHQHRDCPNLNGSQKECWSCREIGHISRECPYSNSKKRKTLGSDPQRFTKNSNKGKKGKPGEEIASSSKSATHESSTSNSNNNTEDGKKKTDDDAKNDDNNGKKCDEHKDDT